MLLTPRVFNDDRGFFYESWNQRALAEALGLTVEQSPVFAQDNHSSSSFGVVRGLHFQLEPEPQAKLIRCVVGEIFDVAVDLRQSSPTFGQSVGALLSASNHQQLWVPVGFAHGFLTLSNQAEVLYKASHFWSKSCERSLLWNDPALGIDWPLGRLGDQKACLAPKDAEAPKLAELASRGELFP